ncbi:hypothetical protein EUTSA_v10002817mg, partial [Eutrema salsugineum]
MKRETLRLLDLPRDLVEEILSRVPATSLGQLQSTCKRWKALFKDPVFIKKHLDKAAKRYLVLMLIDYRIYSMSINLQGIRNIVDPIIDIKRRLSLNDLQHISEQDGTSDFFHCDGLLLRRVRDDKLVVWNPCHGQTRWIQFNSYKPLSRVALGYENSKSCHNYKILRLWDNLDFFQDNKFRPVLRFEIYEFSSDSLRVLEEALLDCLILGWNGVSLMGNIYWVVSDTKDKSIFLLSFDFTTERLRRLCLPFGCSNVDTIALSVVKDEQISVLHQRCDTPEIEIWVTTNDKNDHTKVLSWRKFLAVDISTHHDWMFWCIRNQTSREIVCIFGEDNEYREISSVYTDKLRWPYMLTYFPSLAQIRK